MKNDDFQAASFRDPAGFLFTRDSVLYRQVNRSYREHYDLFSASGLYARLVGEDLLVPHVEAPLELAQTDEVYRVIRPERVPFIAYPYEWSFSQLKDAALTTLKIQKTALEHRMILKDASAYNIQFHHGRPRLIDTLSFEKYVEGEPWIAYRQFCQHFLAPLALMSLVDIRLGLMLRIHLDGLPLDLTSRLLPWRTRLRFCLLTHIHLHAKSQKRYENRPLAVARRKMSLQALRGLVDNLETCVKKLRWKAELTEWADYYDTTNYSPAAFEHKTKLIENFLEQLKPAGVWDMGANTGRFSRLASARGIPTVSFDIDPAAVEKNYLRVKSEREPNLLPLLCDLTNPSPAIGWENRERMALGERGPAHTVMALALVHHLAISNNLPFDRIARYFTGLGDNLIIEFVPKSDSQVQRLLASRRDIFDCYNREEFEKTFKRYYQIERAEPVRESERILYLLHKR
ncbi:MAG: SAM-dependent methyltransferase [Candidatus Zixiibacteriota bacterium]